MSVSEKLSEGKKAQDLSHDYCSRRYRLKMVESLRMAKIMEELGLFFTTFVNRKKIRKCSVKREKPIAENTEGKI